MSEQAAPKRILVCRFCSHPILGTVLQNFLLPEWRAGFQIVHQIFSRFKRGDAMTGGGGNHHDLIAGHKAPMTVDHQRIR